MQRFGRLGKMLHKETTLAERQVLESAEPGVAAEQGDSNSSYAGCQGLTLAS